MKKGLLIFCLTLSAFMVFAQGYIKISHPCTGIENLFDNGTVNGRSAYITSGVTPTYRIEWSGTRWEVLEGTDVLAFNSTNSAPSPPHFDFSGWTTGTGCSLIGSWQVSGPGTQFALAPTAINNPSSCGVNATLPDFTSSYFDINVNSLAGTSLGTDVTLSSVKLVIEHTFLGDLEIYLRSPSGVMISLIQNRGGGLNNFGNPNNGSCAEVTNLRDDASSPISSGSPPFIGSFRPETPLSTFNDNSNPNGVWRFSIADEAGGDFGTLKYVELVFEDGEPEIRVEDLDGTEIVDGDNSPSTNESTDFGNAPLDGSVTPSRTYRIKNIGDEDLMLNGSPKVNITGSSGFSVTTQPAASTIAGPNGSTTFVVTFDASQIGAACPEEETATVSISNNDGDENPYTFNVKATVEDTEDPTFAGPPSELTLSADEVCRAELPDYTTQVGAMDNCTATANLIITQDPPAGEEIFLTDAETVTITVTDEAGNTNSISFDVSVVDDTPPTPTCLNPVISADAGQCYATFSSSSVATVVDNCGVADVTFDPVLSTFNVGTTTVVVTGIDDAGNMAQCTATVTVNDNEAPTITCPSNFSVDNDPGLCGANVTFTEPTGADNCGVQMVSCSPASNSFFSVGTTPVTCTVTDIHGNTNQCTFNVTVNDTEAPTANCPTDVTVSVPFTPIVGPCEAIATYTIPNPTDNCPGATASANIPSGSSFGLGTTAVTVTAMDAAGNTSNCSFNVTVVDDSRPYWTFFPVTNSVPIYANENCQGVLPDYQIDFDLEAVDKCGGEIIYTQSPAPGTILNGPIEVTLTAEDERGNIATSTFMTPEIQDNTPPTITCPENVSQAVDPGQFYATVNNIAPTASNDNCPGWVITHTISGATTVSNGDDDASGTQFNAGVSTVTYTITDASNQTTTCSFTVNIATVPEIRVEDADGTEIVDGDDTPSASESTDFGNAPMDGSTTTSRTFTIKNIGSADLMLTGSPVVEITGSAAFSITAQPATTTISGPTGMTTFEVTFDASLTGASCPGEQTATISISNTDSDEDPYTFEVKGTPVDNIDPTANCPANITQSNDAGLCGANISFTIPAPLDNCTGATSMASPTSGSFFGIGTSQVTVTATDGAGNTNQCTFNITVNDTEAPTANCPADVTVSVPFMPITGPCEAIATYTIPNPTDNCPGATASANIPSGSSFGLGTTAVTVTAMDAAGNTSNCSFNVTVVDDSRPYWTFFPVTNSVPIYANENCQGVLPDYQIDFDLEAVDKCGGEIIYTQSPAPGTILNGPIEVTLTAEDERGNIATSTFMTPEIQDNTPPTITCPDNVSQSVDAGQTYATVNNIAPTASNDNCPGWVITHTISGATTVSNGDDDASGTQFNAGVSTVTYTITDASNQTTTCSFTVTIATVPEIRVEDADGTEIVDGDDTPSLDESTDFGNAPMDGSTSTSRTFTIKNIGSADLMLNGSPTVDISGSSSFSVTIQPASTTLSGPTGMTTFEVTFDPSLTGEGCPDEQTATISISNTDSDEDPYTFDVKGTPVDNIDPTANCPANITQSSDAGLCGANVSFTIPDPTDNCAGATSMASPASGSFFAVGTSQVTVTATDGAGNTDQCTFTVTVNDNEAPMALCQNVTVQLDANGNGFTTSEDVDNGSDDACGIASLALSQTSFNCLEVGANTETLTVTDNNGNVNTCTTTVTVVDNIAPVALCQNVTVMLDANGDGSTSTEEVDNGSNDACGIASLALSQTSFDCSEVGANTETLTVTDNNGNVNTCTATVTVIDNIVPVALCQNVTVQLDANGNGSTSTEEMDNGSNDACGIASLALSQTSFDCSEVGANTETLTVTDNNGNTNTCNATITVVDNIAPVALCQNVTVMLDVNGDGSTSAEEVDNGSNDACGIASLALSQTSFDCSEIGANTETLTVTDNNGNTNTCTATVTVEDDTDPVALCQNITVQLDANGMANISTADIDNGSSDNCGSTNELNLSLDQTLFDCQDIGDNNVTLTVRDQSDNIDNCQATVSVGYLQAPTAICQNITVEITPSESVSISVEDVDGGSSAVCSTISLALSQSSFTCSEVGMQTVTLTVTDDLNNVTDNCTATVTVTDPNSYCCDAPVAVCEDLTVQLDASGNGSITAAEVGVNSTAECGLQSEMLSQENFTCADVGSNTVTYTITDINDDSDNCQAIITVEDNVAPTALCQNVTVQLDANGLIDIGTQAVDNGSNDACGVASLSVSPNTFDCDDKGDNTVTLTVTDNNGNTNTCTATAIVEDNIAPEALCKNTTVQLDANGSASIIPSDVNNGSSDNCIYFLSSLNNNTFDCSDVGTNTVLLTISDFSGNSSSCNATVTVEDNVAPTAICQNVTVELDANGEGTISAEAVNNGADDACGIAELALSQTDFDCSHIGTNEVTLTATDVNGNSSTCTANVIVQDNTAPTITTCEGLFAVFNGEEEIASASVIDFSATDACGIQSTTYSPAVITCDELGENVNVLITVTDSGGNANTCTALVKTDGLPCGFMDFGNDGIDCEESSNVEYNTEDETFTITSDGCASSNFTQDNAAYAYAQLCGDGEIIAHVTNIDPLGQGWAGITLRESEAPGAKKVELLSNLGNMLRRAIRTTTNGYAYPAQMFRPQATWLKLVRQGNLFIGYASFDGINWQNVLFANIPMEDCIHAGLLVTNYNASTMVSGTFDNVEVNPASSGMNLEIPHTNQDHTDQSVELDFNLYPNPASDRLFLEIIGQQGQRAEVEILNQLGQRVLRRTIEGAGSQNEELDLHNLESGTYFIRIATDQSEQVKKFLIVK